MRAGRLAALGIAAYALFALATVPASFVAARAEAASDGRLAVHEAHGTLWRGTARATLATPAGPLAIDGIDWRFAPARLAAGRLAFDVQASAAGLKAAAEVARSPAAWEVRALEAGGDAAAAAALVPLAAAWRPAGRLAIEAPRLAWSGDRVDGEVRAEWRDASLALSPIAPLGSYRIDGRGEGAALRFTLATVEGALRLAGRGELSASGRLAFSGEARAEPAHAERLEPLLRLLGPARADGSRALDLRLR